MNGYFLAIFFSALLLSSSFQVAVYAESDHDEKNGMKTIEWADRCTRTGSVSVIKVNDDDQNKDLKVKEWFDIKVWSDSDTNSINQTLTETGSNTGIFEGAIFLYKDAGNSDHRVLAFSGDVIYAKYADKVGANNTNAVESSMVAKLPVLEWTYGTSPQAITYEPCTVSTVKKILQDPTTTQREIFFPAPLKQIQSGLHSNEVQCKESLVLVARHDDSENKQPACVTPETKERLIERGWTEHLQINVHRIPGEVYIGSTDIPSANNQFALRFYSQLSEDDKEGNMFFSPSSIFTAFAIAHEGARGNTATEMQQVFGFEKDDSKRKVGFAEMQKLLNPHDEEYVLNIANALWLAKGFDVNPEYSQTVKTHYDSNVESVDFTSEKDGLDIINQWVDKKTHGKIEKIFEELDPQTKMAITNAIYFKGDWAKPFDKEKTTNGSFYVNEKTKIQVPMMELKTTYLNTARQDNVQILELPYEGEQLSMLILLPNEVNGIKSLEESLSKDNLDEWMSHLQQSKVKVHMPKFKLETHYDMVSKLQDMGIHDTFGNADFSGISNSGLSIYKAIHKAFVDVNEEGTEAAAATGMAMRESGPMPFTVNHPFVFLIHDNDTGQILFMGRVMDPTK